jgi:hypothetical protein
MPSRRILLDLAAFLDSAASLKLNAPDRAGQRSILEAYLTVCYEELGLAPRLLDGDGMRRLLQEHLPRRFKPSDPLAEFAPAVIAAFLEHLESIATVPFAFELRLGLNDAEEDFLTAVASGDAARDRPPPAAAPFVHGAPKLGRNDPCSCGSGKKYKHCHGK